jgi:hypothetical protein
VLTGFQNFTKSIHNLHAIFIKLASFKVRSVARPQNTSKASLKQLEAQQLCVDKFEDIRKEFEACMKRSLNDLFQTERSQSSGAKEPTSPCDDNFYTQGRMTTA